MIYMLLNDIGTNKVTTLSRINQHLESNYGFKITEGAKDTDYASIMETIQDEILSLKIKGEDAKTSAEISKRLLILEGVKTLREFAITQMQSPKLEPLIRLLVKELVDNFHRSGMDNEGFDREVNKVMDGYNSSEFRFPADHIERRIREAAMKEINNGEEHSFEGEECETDERFEEIEAQLSALRAEVDRITSTDELGVGLEDELGDEEGVSMVNAPFMMEKSRH